MSSVRLEMYTGAQPGLTMSISISASWSGRWMTMLSGEWLAPCQARSMRSPPISSVRRSWNVSSFGGLAGSSSRSSRRRVEQHDAVRGRQERALVGAVGDPVEVPLHPADVVALLVERRPERGAGDRCVVG